MSMLYTAPAARLSRSRSPTDRLSPPRARRVNVGLLGAGLLAFPLGLAQLDPADLAGQRLGQVVHELDLAGIGVGRQVAAHEALDLRRGLLAGLVPLREHHEGLHDVP